MYGARLYCLHSQIAGKASRLLNHLIDLVRIQCINLAHVFNERIVGGFARAASSVVSESKLSKHFTHYGAEIVNVRCK